MEHQYREVYDYGGVARALISEKGEILDINPEWKKTFHKSSGKPAIRETDTLDTFVDSSWYFLRFCSPGFKNGSFDEKDANYWMPVDQYI